MRRQAAIGSFFSLLRRAWISQLEDACAKSVPSSSSSFASAVATREPGWTMLPSARSMPERERHRPDEARLQLDRHRRGAGLELGVDGAAHHGVEHGREDAAVDGAERVVVLLARLVGEDDVAGRDEDRVEADEVGDRRRGQQAVADPVEGLEPGEAVRLAGRVDGVVPGDRARAGHGSLPSRLLFTTDSRRVRFEMQLCARDTRGLESRELRRGRDAVDHRRAVDAARPARGVPRRPPLRAAAAAHGHGAQHPQRPAEHARRARDPAA